LCADADRHRGHRDHRTGLLLARLAHRPQPAMSTSTSARAAVAELRRQGRTLAVAESLTGGLLAASIVAVPGASAVFRGGAVAYATDTKAAVLGVEEAWLAARGPVDPRVATMMADGARRLFAADLALATTGVAGPGPADGHAAGTVYLACTGAGRERVRGVRLSGDRQAVR